MNQDLQNYINQARVAGKPDQAIMQELRNSGWQESDISQAFGATQGAIPEIGNPLQAASGPVGSSALSAKLIGGIILGIIVIGGIATVLFLRSKAPLGTKLTSLVSSTTAKGPGDITCKDLLPDSKFQSIVPNGTSYALVDEKDDLSAGEGVASQGLNTMAQQQGKGQVTFSKGSFQLICSYVANDNKFNAGWVSGDYIFSLTYSTEKPAETSYNEMKNTLDSMAGKSQTIGQMTITAKAVEDVPGMGSSAYFDGSAFTALSTNKKYFFVIDGAAIKDSQDPVARALGKAYDDSLNNY